MTDNNSQELLVHTSGTENESSHKKKFLIPHPI